MGAPLKVDGLAYDGDLQMGTGNNFRELKRGGRLVSEVHFIGGTVAQVGNVDYFDDAGNLTLRQIYDLRGFLAVNQYYGRAGELLRTLSAPGRHRLPGALLRPVNRKHTDQLAQRLKGLPGARPLLL